MTQTKKIKKPLPTKAAMAQIYENSLWGGKRSEDYSGLGSHHPETVNQYIAVVAAFLKDFAQQRGKVFGNQNSNNHKQKSMQGSEALYQ